MNIEKGKQVIVYDDPITCQRLEGNATVTKVLSREDWSDVHGRPIVRCNVRFKGDTSVYERDVSALVPVPAATDRP